MCELREFARLIHSINPIRQVTRTNLLGTALKLLQRAAGIAHQNESQQKSEQESGQEREDRDAVSQSDSAIYDAGAVDCESRLLLLKGVE